MRISMSCTLIMSNQQYFLYVQQQKLKISTQSTIEDYTVTFHQSSD